MDTTNQSSYLETVKRRFPKWVFATFVSIVIIILSGAIFPLEAAGLFAFSLAFFVIPPVVLFWLILTFHAFLPESKMKVARIAIILGGSLLLLFYSPILRLIAQFLY